MTLFCILTGITAAAANMGQKAHFKPAIEENNRFLELILTSKADRLQIEEVG